jgi:phosphoadenosine phosphosulfate reductase
MNENGSSSVPTHSTDELRTISDNLESSEPQEILRWALTTFGDKLTMATAFGAEGCVIMDIMARLRDETGITPDIFNLDTGYQFQETLEMRVTMQSVTVSRFALCAPGIGAPNGSAPGRIDLRSNPTLCCYQRKVVRYARRSNGFGAWVSAIRRDQTPERATQPMSAPEPKHENLVKINPSPTGRKIRCGITFAPTMCRPILCTIKDILRSAAIRARVRR